MPPLGPTEAGKPLVALAATTALGQMDRQMRARVVGGRTEQVFDVSGLGQRERAFCLKYPKVRKSYTRSVTTCTRNPQTDSLLRSHISAIRPTPCGTAGTQVKGPSTKLAGLSLAQALWQSVALPIRLGTGY